MLNGLTQVLNGLTQVLNGLTELYVGLVFFRAFILMCETQYDYVINCHTDI